MSKVQTWIFGPDENEIISVGSLATLQECFGNRLEIIYCNKDSIVYAIYATNQKDTVNLNKWMKELAPQGKQVLIDPENL